MVKRILTICIAAAQFCNIACAEQGTDQDQNGQDEKLAFVDQKANEDIYSGYTLVEQIIPYEVKASTVIPGVLITGMNSDLPGTVIGQVSENVYDSISGKYLLIPQGTRIIGKYD